MNQPHSEENERGLLGSAMLDPKKVMEIIAEHNITPESFYIPVHRVVFERVYELHSEGNPIDMLTVWDGLNDTRVDFSDLERLVDIATSSHAEHYAKAVKQDQLRRKAIAVSQEIIADCLTDKEAEEVIASAAEKISDIHTPTEHKTPAEHMLDNIVVLDNAMQGITSGVTLPFEKFSTRTGGLQRGSVIPVLGRDGKGKSGMMAQCMDFWAGQNIPTLVFSFEDVPRRVLLRMAGCREWFSARQAETGWYEADGQYKKMDEFRASELRRKEQKYADWIAQRPFFIEGDHMTAEQIFNKIRYHKDVHKIEVVVIDAFKDIVHSDGSNETNCEAHISQVLQRAAKKFDVAMPVVSHLHDLPDDTPISMRNINGSKVQKKGARQGIIFQDAGIDGVDGETMFALQNSKSNYGRAGQVLLRRDPSVLCYMEV